MRLIDADALDFSYENVGGTADECSVDDVKAYIASAPTVEAEPLRHGHWIPITAYNENDIAYCDYACSECGREITKRVLCVPPRCEYCGAKMDGGEQDETD